MEILLKHTKTAESGKYNEEDMLNDLTEHMGTQDTVDNMSRAMAELKRAAGIIWSKKKQSVESNRRRGQKSDTNKSLSLIHI